MIKSAITTDIVIEYGEESFNPQVRLPDGRYYFPDGSVSEYPRDRAWNTTRLKTFLGPHKFKAWQRGEVDFVVKLVRENVSAEY